MSERGQIQSAGRDVGRAASQGRGDGAAYGTRYTRHSICMHLPEQHVQQTVEPLTDCAPLTL